MKLAKLIAMDPGKPDAYSILGAVYKNAGDFTNMHHYLKAMELSDTGTDHNGFMATRPGLARQHAYSYFSQPTCVVPKPSWFTDALRLKRMADRAAAACPNDNEALRMRSLAYLGKHARGDGASPSADDLRQALRDRRRIAEMYEEEALNVSDICGWLRRRLRLTCARASRRIFGDEISSAVRRK